MSDREGRFADGRLFYRVWDAPSPRAAVVLAHGYAEHCGRYEHVGDALSGAGLSTWALDHLGHGRSEGERADMGPIEVSLGNLDRFIDLVTAEVPGVPVFLLGHSAGGLLAVAYAEEHQDRLAGMVVSAPAVMLNPMLEALLGMEEIPPLPLAPLVSRDPGVVAGYENDPLVWQGPPSRARAAETLELIPKVRERFGEIRIPILILHGGDDGLVPPQASEELAAGVSSTDVTLRVWPGLYHEIFNEPEKDEVIGEMVVWISRHVDERPRPEGEGA